MGVIVGRSQGMHGGGPEGSRSCHEGLIGYSSESVKRVSQGLNSVAQADDWSFVGSKRQSLEQRN